VRVPALALAQRALLLDARRHAPYVLRALLVVVMLLALWTAERWGRFMGAPGLHLFGWVIFTNFWFVSVFGVSTFAAVVAEEKENMTLGLLKMAGFGAASILIGKSIGQLLTMVLLLLVQLPFALLAITLGGVSQHQIAAAYVALFAHLFFVYGLALLCSVVASRTAAATRATGWLLAAYYLVPGFLFAVLVGQTATGPGAAAGAGGALSSAVAWLHENTAWAALTATIATGFDAPLLDTPVVVTAALGAALCVVAALVFGPCTRNEVAAAPPRGFLGDLARGGRRRAISRPRGHPLVWKDFQFLSGGTTGLVLRLLTYTAILVAVTVLAPDMRQEHLGQMVMTVSFVVLLFDLGIQAGRFLREEITWRTLPTLATLPMPMSSWIYAKAAGSLAIALPSLAFLALGAALSPDAVRDFLREMMSHSIGWYIGAVIVFGLHLTVLLSLRLRRGAFPVAVLLVFLMNMLLGMMLATSRSSGVEGCFGFLAFALLAIAFGMHPAIGRAVAQKASE
jgi:ABC-type transport system involved in multi-copper enzyme maturation permease subunit